MESPTGIIPEALMDPSKKNDVVRFLLAQPLPGKLKSELFAGWAVTVGMRVRGSEVDSLKASGTDAGEDETIPRE